MSKKRTIFLAAVLMLTVIGLTALYLALRPTANGGSKTVTVNIDHLTGDDAAYTLTTDAEYLRAALEERELIGGVEGDYGLWVTTVDGETADETQQQWWGYDVNGTMAEYGVDGQIVTDGDVYDFTLHVGF